MLADSQFRAQVEAAARLAESFPRGIAIGDPIHGFEDYDDVLAEYEPHDIDDPILGHNMLYTSGTTGRPKPCKTAVSRSAKMTTGPSPTC